MDHLDIIFKTKAKRTRSDQEVSKGKRERERKKKFQGLEKSMTSSYYERGLKFSRR